MKPSSSKKPAQDRTRRYTPLEEPTDHSPEDLLMRAFAALAMILLVALPLAPGETSVVTGLPATPVGMIPLAAAVFLAYPKFRDLIARPLRGTPAPGAWWTAALVLAIAGAWLTTRMHVVFPFLGDGSSYLAEIIRIRADEAYHTFLIKPTSFLTGVIIQWLARATSGPDVAAPYAIVGTAAFVILLAGFAWLVRRENGPVRALFFALVFLNSAALFFFGYVELYALQYAFTALFFLSSWRCIKSGSSPFVPLGLLIAAVLCGGSSLVYLPAWLMAALWRNHRVRSIPLTRLVLGGIALELAAIAAAYAVNGWTNDSQYLMPLAASSVDINGLQLNAVTSTVFSFGHLAELLAVYVLNALTAMVILVCFLVMRRRVSNPFSPDIAFFAFASISGFLLVLFGKTMFGLLRDWDMAVAGTLPLLFLAGTLLVRLYETGVLAPARTTAAVGLVSFALMFGWLGMNFSDASAKRFESLVDMNADRISLRWTWNGLENLRKYFASKSDEVNYRRILGKMLATRFNAPDSYEKMFELTMNASDPGPVLDDLFAALLLAAREPFPENDSRHLSPAFLRQKTASLVLDAVQTGAIARDDKRIGEFGAAFGDWRERGFVDAVLDTTAAPRERADRARAALPDSVTDALLAGVMGQLYARAGEAAEAAPWLERALVLDKGRYPAMYLTLAGLYDDAMHDVPAAIAVLEKAAIDCRLSPMLPEIRSALDEMRARSRR